MGVFLVQTLSHYSFSTEVSTRFAPGLVVHFTRSHSSFPKKTEHGMSSCHCFTTVWTSFTIIKDCSCLVHIDGIYFKIDVGDSEVDHLAITLLLFTALRCIALICFEEYLGIKEKPPTSSVTLFGRFLPSFTSILPTGISSRESFSVWSTRLFFCL